MRLEPSPTTDVQLELWGRRKTQDVKAPASVPSRTLTICGQLHRSLGLTLCCFFALWFASGIVLLFVPYPQFTDSERFAWLRVIAWRSISINPTQALTKSGLSDNLAQVRLTMIGERPAYHFHPWQGPVVSVYADTGERLTDLSVDSILRITSQTFPALALPQIYRLEDDQWTVHQRFDALRPLYRIQLQDALGTDVYVSARSGEVVQHTTQHERGWNYLGAVTHWIYPTILRRHWWWWDQTVWWLALFGIISVVTGGVIGFWRVSQARVDWSLYRGMWRWHHGMGLACLVFLFTWIFSGWLSMDHGRLFSDPTPTQEEQERFRGGPLRLAELPPQEFFRTNDIREVVWGQVAGQPLLLFRQSPEQQMVVTTASDSSPPQILSLLDTSILQRAAEAVFPGVQLAATELVTQEDDYHYRSDDSPLPPLVRVRFADAASTWLHIDPRFGMLREKLDHSRRLYRWLYNGLHRFDFAYFRARPVLRKLVVTTLCSAGFMFSLTGVVLAWRRIFHRYHYAFHARSVAGVSATQPCARSCLARSQSRTRPRS